MKGRRIFDHVDPYLAPPWHDPPEPPECPLCEGEGQVVQGRSIYFSDHAYPELVVCPDCGGTGDRP